MPKLSVFLTDDVYALVEKDIEENGQIDKRSSTGVSAAISRLVVAGSKYEYVTTKEFREKV